jgi:RNA methyltransferase, TrmH family
MMDQITSLANPQIKEIVKLRQRKHGQPDDLIIIEGKKEIKMAIDAGFRIEKFFYRDDLDKQINDAVGKPEIFKTSAAVFEKIAYRENPDGYLALAKPKHLKLFELKLSSQPLIIILESVEKPGNLGAVLRTADAAGIDALIITDPKIDLYNPNVIRASLGAVFTKQSVICRTAEAITWLKEKHIKIYAATPDTKTFYFKNDFKKASAIVVGTEHEGLSDDWLSQADAKIKIPMLGKIDSLNASVSAAILIYEAVRQRQAG